MDKFKVMDGEHPFYCVRCKDHFKLYKSPDCTGEIVTTYAINDSKSNWINKQVWEPFDQPTDHKHDIVLGKLVIDSKEATEAVEALTKALANCAVAYQHLNNVMKGG